MFVDVPKKSNISFYVSRLKKLISKIKSKHQTVSSGIVLLIAGFEQESQLFEQESSFFYLTGIEEPGVVLTYNLANDQVILYVPQYEQDRSKWIDTEIPCIPDNASAFGVHAIKYLGELVKGFSIGLFFDAASYKNILSDVKSIIGMDGVIFTLSPSSVGEYVQQRFVVERMKQIEPSFSNRIKDVSDLVAQMRREKEQEEIAAIYESISVTIAAHEAAAQAIEPGLTEKELQGTIEYIFIASGATAAFPSVVASGKNGTVLHYTSNKGELHKGDLVVVDIGAKAAHYCADLTRTYPVSGAFTIRQKELYNAVLETQNYVAEQAVPGMWLSNPDQPDKSLQHLALKFLKGKGLEQYFTHGIGHFLGLDVHDVGNRQLPLQEGDVFTIEPGIYIPQENIGIRIEDIFLLGSEGAISLSEDLPKDVKAVEHMMKNDLD